jgi:hypothetical protein
MCDIRCSVADHTRLGANGCGGAHKWRIFKHFIALFNSSLFALTISVRPYQLGQPKREPTGIAVVLPFRLKDLLDYGLMEFRRN